MLGATDQGGLTERLRIGERGGTRIDAARTRSEPVTIS